MQPHYYVPLAALRLCSTYAHAIYARPTASPAGNHIKDAGDRTGCGLLFQLLLLLLLPYVIVIVVVVLCDGTNQTIWIGASSSVYGAGSYVIMSYDGDVPNHTYAHVRGIGSLGTDTAEPGSRDHRPSRPDTQTATAPYTDTAISTKHARRPSTSL